MIFRKRVIFLVIGTVFICLFSVFTYFLLTDEYSDSKFRTMQDKIALTEAVNLTGLNKLFASGGPMMAFSTLKEKLGSVEKSVIIVDGTREQYGYIKGIPTTYFGYQSKNLELRYIVRRFLFTGTIDPKSDLIVNERDMAQKYGFEYVNLRIDSKLVTPDGAVDEFVAYFDNPPENTWFHFHCRHGKGRTSLALVMLDIMRNAPEVELEDIVRRQHLLGSVNLSDAAVWRKNSTYPSKSLEKRKKFVQDFYAFIVQRKAGGVQLWSEWRAKQ